MGQTTPEIIIAYMASLVFWVALVAFIWFAGQRVPRLMAFRECAINQWKPAAAIAAVYAVATALRGSNMDVFSTGSGAIMTFCQAVIGLALARQIAGFEPLPVAQAIVRREHAVRSVLLMIGIAVLAVVGYIMADMLGTGIARLLGEVKQAGSNSNSTMPALWQMFFYFLAGAGIAEETVYRLVLLSLFWRLTRRPWIAIILSGVAFGAYHLTPLSGMYMTFWQYPLTQFLGSSLIGVVWGYVYVKRGYETSVLAHTLSDWLPMAVFMLVSG
jgi:membrane protease YdiL (CAAX protease family)